MLVNIFIILTSIIKMARPSSILKNWRIFTLLIPLFYESISAILHCLFMFLLFSKYGAKKSFAAIVGFLSRNFGRSMALCPKRKGICIGWNQHRHCLC